MAGENRTPLLPVVAYGNPLEVEASRIEAGIDALQRALADPGHVAFDVLHPTPVGVPRVAVVVHHTVLEGDIDFSKIAEHANKHHRRVAIEAQKPIAGLNEPFVMALGTSAVHERLEIMRGYL